MMHLARKDASSGRASRMVRSMTLDIAVDLLDNPCRDTTYYDIIRDVPRYNCASPHNDIVADGDSRKNGNVAANPYIVADGYGFGDAEVFPSACRGKRVADRCDQGIRADHHIVANADFTDIQDGQIVVPGEVVADKDILAVVAVESLGNPDLIAFVTEVLGQTCILRLMSVSSMALYSLHQRIARSLRASTSGSS